LIGLRGSGKTTVGERLARKLDRDFIDLDLLITLSERKSIRSIFDESGESGFRDIEENALAALVEHAHGSIIATGGGAILRESNRDRLRRHGAVVWLSAGIDTIRRRLAARSSEVDDRPPLTPLGTLDELEAILVERAPIYQELADFTMPADDLDAERIASEIVAWWGEGSFRREPKP
jgi:shikimate kinase